VRSIEITPTENAPEHGLYGELGWQTLVGRFNGTPSTDRECKHALAFTPARPTVSRHSRLRAREVSRSYRGNINQPLMRGALGSRSEPPGLREPLPHARRAVP
jgi:hypothetical protein